MLGAYMGIILLRRLFHRIRDLRNRASFCHLYTDLSPLSLFCAMLRLYMGEGRYKAFAERAPPGVLSSSAHRRIHFSSELCDAYSGGTDKVFPLQLRRKTVITFSGRSE